jgi:hypothetical protein
MGISNAGRILCCAALILCVAACGGGGDATIGGTVVGLAPGLSVTLQNENADNLSLSVNGPFTFPSLLSTGDAFNVTVLTQPVGQNCAVIDGSGTVDTDEDSVNTVIVSCTTTSSVGGTLTGLNPGTSVTLSDGNATLPIAVNGQFAFPETLAAGSIYDVTVTVSPVGQSCTVTNATGTVVASITAMVTVTCQ